MPSKKAVFDIDLLDSVTHGIIKTGTAEGKYPKEALRKFSKDLSPTINLKEMRDAKYERYWFMWRKRK